MPRTKKKVKSIVKTKVISARVTETAHRGRFSYLPADREKYISARTLGVSFDREHLLLLFQCNAAEKEKRQWRVDDPMDALYIKSNLRLVVNLQDCIKAQQSRAYAQKVKVSICRRWRRLFSMCKNTGMILTKNFMKLPRVLTEKWQRLEVMRNTQKLN